MERENVTTKLIKPTPMKREMPSDDSARLLLEYLMGFNKTIHPSKNMSQIPTLNVMSEVQ